MEVYHEITSNVKPVAKIIIVTHKGKTRIERHLFVEEGDEGKVDLIVAEKGFMPKRLGDVFWTSAVEEKTVECKSCGLEVLEGEEYYVRIEWKRRGWSFCEACVTSLKAKTWAEKQIELEKKNEGM